MRYFNYKQMFWTVFVCLLFVPITNTFFVSLSKLIKSFINNYTYKSSLNELIGENNYLKSKVRYYKTTAGVKALIKDRLEKVDDGEILIKYSD